MNNENSGEVDNRRESALTDSSDTADDNDGPEDLKPPDSKRFQLEMDEMLARIREAEVKIKSLEKKVSVSEGKIKAATVVDKEKLRIELQELRIMREKVIEERKQFDLELKGLNVQVQKKNDACTKLQAGVRYKSEARIDEAVRRLEHQMQAQQLKLSEEKRIVAEIDTLKRSKRNLNDYLVLKQHVDQLRNKQKNLRSQRDGCVKRINGLKSREEEVKNLLDSEVSDKSEEVERQQLHVEQLKEIELLKKELDDLHAKKRDLRATFTKERNDYYAATREIKKKGRTTKKKNERLPIVKAVVSSRAMEQPYEKEIALCDKLVNYLEGLHINAIHLPELPSTSSADKEPALSLAASADFSLSGDKGVFLRRKSATDDLVGVYAGVNRTSRRGSRKGRRSSAKEAPRKLNLHAQVVEHLLTLGLSPPSTAADIPKVLEELQEKKDFFESAQAPNTVLALAGYDPMTPITEEAAPEFPSKFEESGESETPEAVLQNTTDIEDNTGDGNLQNNSQATYDEKSLTLKEEEVSGSETSGKADTELTEELNGLLPKKETEESQLSIVDLEEETSAVNSDLSNAKPAALSHEVSSDDTGHISPADSFTESNTEGLCLPNGDRHESNEVLTKRVESENCRSKEDKLMYPEMEQVHSEKTNSAPKDNSCSFMPLVQSNTICPEQSSFASSSSRSANILIEENGLEAVYDRNSMNEGGGMVKIQCEKCPA